MMKKKIKKRIERFSKDIKKLLSHSEAHSFKTMSKYLNSQKILTLSGKQWTPKSVKKLMES